MNKLIKFLHTQFQTRYRVRTIAFILIACFSVGGYYTFRRVARLTDIATPLIKTPEEIKGKLVTLKRLKEEYFIDFHNMFSLTVRRNMEFPERITLDYTIRFLKDEMAREQQGKVFLYCIFDNIDHKLIGALQIREKNPSDYGQFGCWVNEQYWGGGRFQEALDLISKAYFKLTGAPSFIAHVRLWNKRSYHALKKYGFKDVGYFYENGQPTRHILELKPR